MATFISYQSTSSSIPELAADPTNFSNPNTPRVWYNTTDGVLRFHNGGLTQELDIKGDLILQDLSGNQLTTD